MSASSANKQISPEREDTVNTQEYLSRVDNVILERSTDLDLSSISSSIEDIEIHLLLEGIYQHHGLDFRDYSLPSLRRRILRAVHGERVNSISELQHRVLRDRASWERLLKLLSVHVTMFFRDPDLFLTLREKVIPQLAELPFFRIWHIGCSSGEEAYSMSILLHEEGLLDRGRLYATDLNDGALGRGRQGIYSLDLLEAYESNYKAAGGKHKLSDYYTARYESGIMRPALRERIVFAQHNLTSDTAFTEFDLIFCRNVLIYFNKALQQRVHKLVDNSLRPEGFFVLGQKENLKHTAIEDNYSIVGSSGEPVSLYQKTLTPDSRKRSSDEG
ncbi:MAG TPA: protein-glutamate O-methyltransferase CheR [Candidatus Kapabacteria bacterium]|nr:protein-glutamate O-methyltransferase CheR [Candidatus Kapabacteria bacterium]